MLWLIIHIGYLFLWNRRIWIFTGDSSLCSVSIGNSAICTYSIMKRSTGNSNKKDMNISDACQSDASNSNTGDIYNLLNIKWASI